MNKKYLVWNGKVIEKECKEHFYAWSGKTPCTGIYRCVLCGKEGNSTLRTSQSFLQELNEN